MTLPFRNFPLPYCTGHCTSTPNLHATLRTHSGSRINCRATKMTSAAVPALNIASSSTTVSVKIIDLTTISGIHADRLFAPTIPGVQYLDPAPSFSFLIEHHSGQKLLFDLGIPKDLSALGPEVASRVKDGGYHIDVKRDVADELFS